MYTFRIPGVFP